MEPVFGFALYLFACIIVAIVASKKGRKGWLYLLLTLACGVPLVVVSSGAGASPIGAAFAGFLSPAVGLIVALSSKTSEQQAIADGEYGEFRKCPFCAESVRKEAIKCRHCGSDIPQEA